MRTDQGWITSREVDELQEAVLWAGGLSETQRATLRTMLAHWCAMESALREATAMLRELHGMAHGLRESQGG